MVVYLSSAQASATTGGAVRVDGGYIDSILPYEDVRPGGLRAEGRGVRARAGR